MRVEVQAVMEQQFGLQSLRPGQQEVIEALLTEGSALAVFPTGAGKSLCYQLPALLFDGVTVVISPLIALMKDQIDFLLSKGIAAARLDSTLSIDDARDVTQGLRDGKLRLLYVAPERFNNERFLEQLGRARIALFAIDEAHCISEWGHNFRPDYLKLAETARALKVERVLCLTATATPSVVQDICDSFNIPKTSAIITGFERPNLFLSTVPIEAAGRTAFLARRLKERAAGSAIVYVTLQATAEKIAAALTKSGLPARAYHAGMKDEDRLEVQEWWKQSGDGIVVATIAFGMGIDKADVRYVYHYNLPKGLESYSQEIGRAGRDGKPSIVELIGGPEDVETLENFAYGDTPTPDSLRKLLTGILTGDPVFDVSLYDLSNEYDIRALVLRTALTYLELLGVLRQGTPFYGTYKVKLLSPLEKVLSAFSADRASFLSAVFAQAKVGTEWFTLDATKVAEIIGEDRDRIIKALNYLSEQGLAELKASEARQRFTLLAEAPDIESLLSELMNRFERREKQEIARIQHIIQLIEHNGCQSNFLMAYFGQERAQPCGHCTYCETSTATKMPEKACSGAISDELDVPVFQNLLSNERSALGDPRQQARFLCGLTSPALTRAKLSRHKLFGALTQNSFRDVLEWCESNAVLWHVLAQIG